MKFVKKRLQQNIIWKCLQIVKPASRFQVLITGLIQVALSIFDLLGVATIGVLGALAVTGIQSQEPGNRVSQVLKILHISNLSFQQQIATLGISAATVLIFRTLLSIVVTRRILKFLSAQSVSLGKELTSKVLAQNLIQVQSRSLQDTIYSLTSGMNAATMGVLGTSVSLISDLSLLIVLLFGLLVVDSTIAITTVVMFGTIGLILHKLLSVKSKHLGVQNADLSIKINQEIIEAIESYKETTVRNRKFFYVEKIGRDRLALSNILADIQFLPNVSKYIIESSIVIGALSVAGIQFAVQDARHAVASLSVFMAAGSRMAPAILRLQQNLMQLNNNLGAAEPTLELLEALKAAPLVNPEKSNTRNTYPDFDPEITFRNVHLSYDRRKDSSLNDINLIIKSGTMAAVIGSSGAGKSSLANVLLGLIPQSNGEVLISGCKPTEAIEKWPGGIAYVPQNTFISNGSLRENVLLGYEVNAFSDSEIQTVLKIAQLDNFVNVLPNGLDTNLGDRGTQLSGGQRQRIGIARALITKPKLLIMDEATSALDGQTELEFANAISHLKGHMTMVVIAHRLTTIKTADVVFYLENGSIRASGTLDSVKSQVPYFDIHSELESEQN